MKRERASRIRIGTFSLWVLWLLLPFPVAAQQDPESIGSVVALEPEVLLFHRGQTRWMRTRLRDGIFLHDTILTRERAKAQVLFQDDSLLTLGENARIEVSEHIYQPAENRRSTVLQLFAGKVRAIVGAAFSQEGSRFQVHTPTAVVGTRMTQFIVWVVSPDLTIVIVLEGEVMVRNLVETVRGEVLVREGFMSQIRVDQPPTEPMPAPSEQMNQQVGETRVPKAAFSARPEAPAPEEKAEGKPAGEAVPAEVGALKTDTALPSTAAMEETPAGAGAVPESTRGLLGDLPAFSPPSETDRGADIQGVVESLSPETPAASIPNNDLQITDQGINPPLPEPPALPGGPPGPR